jgi:hypothetical protein
MELPAAYLFALRADADRMAAARLDGPVEEPTPRRRAGIRAWLRRFEAGVRRPAPARRKVRARLKEAPRRLAR